MIASTVFTHYLAVRIPVRTFSPNGRNVASPGAMHAERRRCAEQHDVARLIVASKLAARGTDPSTLFPCSITLTRVSPGKGLDPHDNLPASQKHIVDGIAHALGLRDDRDPRVTWRYVNHQGERGVHETLVLIEYTSVVVSPEGA